MDNLLYGKVLLIIDNQLEAEEIFSYLTYWGLEVFQCHSHLQALTCMEDTAFDAVLVCSNNLDIDSLEFCRLVRRREKAKQRWLENVHLILIGDEKDRLSIIEKDFWDLDDFLIRPLWFEELRWRLATGIRKLRKYKEICNSKQYFAGQEVLNKDELYFCITSELNRSWRKRGQMCLLLVQLKGLDVAGLNYGEEWMVWLDNYLLGTMSKYLRDYDRIGSFDNGVWCLVIPDSSRQGLEGLIKRLKSDMQALVQTNQIVQFSNIQSMFQGVLLNLELQSYKEYFAFDQLWQWLIDKSKTRDIEEVILPVTLNESGLYLEKF